MLIAVVQFTPARHADTIQTALQLITMFYSTGDACTFDVCNQILLTYLLTYYFVVSGGRCELGFTCVTPKQ